MPTMTTHGGVLYYVVKVPKDHNDSVESGWDNPFRPGGDLSREADEIVELIKSNKPITPTPDQTAPPTSLDVGDYNVSNNLEEAAMKSSKKVKQLNLTAAPRSVNGTAKNDTNAKPAAPGALDVQRGTVKPDGDASQVEHVTIKKKPKCKCCVIQ